MGNSKNTISTSKRRRSSEHSQRRFASALRLPSPGELPSPATIPRKRRLVYRGVACVAACAVILIILATVITSSKRQRSHDQSSYNQGAERATGSEGRRGGVGRNSGPLNVRERRARNISRGPPASPETHESRAAEVGHDKRVNDSQANTQQVGSIDDTESYQENESKIQKGSVSDEESSQTSTSSLANGEEDSPTSQENAAGDMTAFENEQAARRTNASAAKSDGEEPGPSASTDKISIKDFPERIEWFARDDLKDGTRPMCRISKPCLLSSGVILVPSWMKKWENLLHRCGLGEHLFYESPSQLPGVAHQKDIEGDFALTIHPTRFQEPTHISSVFLTEHILKSSFLLDTMASRVLIPSGVKVNHCFADHNETHCSLENTTPPPTFAPAIFVPRRIEERSSHSWSKKLVEMFGRAHGHDGSVIHLNVSTILVKSHKGMKDNLAATCFRSVLTADAMFRHFPANALASSSFFSRKNGIDRTARKLKQNDKCSVSIGIMDLNEGPRGILGVSDFSSRLQQFAKMAVPSANVAVELIKIEDGDSLEDHIQKIQGLDVYVAGSGDEMSSLAYLSSSSTVVEIKQFGMDPDTHRSLAQSIGVKYRSLRAKPQPDTFKACLEGQITHMRAKGTIADGEFPAWYTPLLQTWDAAVSEFAFNGTSNFDILSNHTGIANFDSRHCAKMQSLSFNHEDAARTIALLLKEMCDAS